VIKDFEGYREKAYLCSAKKPTLGWGTTKYPNGKNVKIGDMTNKVDAEKYILNDLKWAENTVNKKVEVQISQNMYDALVSFVYNLGSSIFVESKCTLLRKLNAQDYTGASNEFRRWNRAGGRVVKGLVKRRYKESCHFVGI
jgi:lysozyme